MIDSFTCTPFMSEYIFFNNAVTSVADGPPYCDEITVVFNDVIKFSDANLNNGLCDVHYNQCISNTLEFSIFILPWVG